MVGRTDFSCFVLEEAHVNTCYKHFYYFVTEFDLVKPRELEALREMTARICSGAVPPPASSGAGPSGGAFSRRPPLPSAPR